MISDTEFVIDDWTFDTEKVFVYGKQVDDFRAVDYDRIFTLGIGAIQELSKENDQLKSELQSLKEKMDRIEAMLAQGDTK